MLLFFPFFLGRIVDWSKLACVLQIKKSGIFQLLCLSFNLIFFNKNKKNINEARNKETSLTNVKLAITKPDVAHFVESC